MNFSPISRLIAIEAQIHYIFDHIDHDTLYIHVCVEDADGKPMLDVPQNKVKDGQITLNISATAVGNFAISEGVLSFDTKFDGVRTHVDVPLTMIFQINALLNGSVTFASEQCVPFMLVEVNEDDSGEQPPAKAKPNLTLVH